jgi:bifunctional non-homologous end joining protein LigD
MSLHPPGFIEPCLPTGSPTAPTGPQWAYEIKHDGFRFICHRDGVRVRVFSRTGHDWSAQLPAIAAALRTLPVRSVILDGEGVICGSDGVSDFGRMRAVFGRKGSPDVFLYAFDVLELDGRDLRAQSWDARRSLPILRPNRLWLIAAIAPGAAANGSRSRTARIPPSSARCLSL